METSGRADQLSLRRLKKQKLHLKDQIARMRGHPDTRYHRLSSSDQPLQPEPQKIGRAGPKAQFRRSDSLA